MRKPKGLNLNLLVTFDALVTEKQLVRAAKKAGVSQPALSYDLKQLRTLFNDQLFIRGRGGLELTARGREAYEAFRPALAQIQSVVAGASHFDPRTAKRQFSIALTDATTFEIIPHLVRRIRKEAPGVQLRVENAGPEDSCFLILSGMVELAVTTQMVLPLGIVGRELYRDAILCVADRRHPRLKNGTMSLEAFQQSHHALVAVDRRIGTTAGGYFRDGGIHLNLSLLLPHWLNIPQAVRGSDLVGFTRRALVPPPKQWDGLVYFDPPFKLPIISFQQIWPERSNHEPGHIWLREQMRAVIEDDLGYGENDFARHPSSARRVRAS